MPISRTICVSGKTTVKMAIATMLWQPLIGCDSQSTREADTAALKKLAAEQATRKEASERELLQRECRIAIEGKKAEYKVLFASRKYWDAALTVRACSEVLDDPALRALVSDAEIKSHLQSIDSAKTPPREKARAIEMLARDYPERGQKYEPRIPQLLAQAEREERAAQAAARKREGVHIGMTQDEVLASSWGKPEHINRTTFASGTHEQWVYGSRSYLYFENGKLTAVQN
jgi:hypothetical protein